MKKLSGILIFSLLLNIILFVFITKDCFNCNEEIAKYDYNDTLQILTKILRDDKLLNLTLDTNKPLNINRYPYLINLYQFHGFPEWVNFFTFPGIGHEYKFLRKDVNFMTIPMLDIYNDTAKVSYRVNEYMGRSFLFKQNNDWILSSSQFQEY